MIQATPVPDVFAYLEAQGIAGGSTGWAIVRRRLLEDTDNPAPDQMVVIAEDGGPPPEIPTSAGLGDSAEADYGVHVTVRGAPFDGDGAILKAQEIFGALHGKLAIKLVGSGVQYLRIRARTAEPVFAGFDAERGRPLMTIAFLLLAPLT